VGRVDPPLPVFGLLDRQVLGLGEPDLGIMHGKPAQGDPVGEQAFHGREPVRRNQ